jgi:hypothetical protein
VNLMIEISNVSLCQTTLQLRYSLRLLLNVKNKTANLSEAAATTRSEAERLAALTKVYFADYVYRMISGRLRKEWVGGGRKWANV